MRTIGKRKKKIFDKKIVNSLTPTAIELMADPEFWAKRIEEQVEYIIRYDPLKATRPDALEVVDSAFYMMEMFQEKLVSQNPTQSCAQIETKLN